MFPLNFTSSLTNVTHQFYKKGRWVFNFCVKWKVAFLSIQKLFIYVPLACTAVTDSGQKKQFPNVHEENEKGAGRIFLPNCCS